MNKFKKKIMQMILAVLAVTSFYSMQAIAQQANSSGQVRRVNADAGKVTIQHGAISELNLEAMTLVYKIDPSLLANIQPGDQVKFTAKREGSEYIVTAISK